MADVQVSLGGFSDSPATGNKTNEGQGYRMVRLDPNGEKLSEVWLGPYIIKVHPTQDGGLFAVRYASFGNYICALRVDANDNLLWDKFLQPFSNQQLGILALEELPDDKMQILGSIQSCCPSGPNEVLTLDGSGEIIRDQHIFQDTFFTSAAAGRAIDGSWILCSDRFEVVNLKPAPDARSANLPLYSSLGFRFLLNVDANRQYLTEFSTDLSDWLALQTNQIQGIELEIFDAGATNAPMRFYRTKPWP